MWMFLKQGIAVESKEIEKSQRKCCVWQKNGILVFLHHMDVF